MKVAISATPVRANFAPILLEGDIEEIFAKAEKCGYGGIELHLRDPYDIDWNKTLKIPKHYSIPVTAIGTGAGARMDGLSFTDHDAEVRHKSTARIMEHIKLASLLKSAVILGSFNGNIGSNPQENGLRRGYYLECLKQSCEFASESGVMILLEPLNRYESDWFNIAEQAVKVINQIGFPNIKYLADTFHMNIEEVNISRTLSQAGSKLGYVHLADSNRQAPGLGHIDFSAILKTLQDIGYDGCLSFECLPVPDIKRPLEYVKKILSQLKTARP